MPEIKRIQISDIIGTSGRYQMLMYVMSFYTSWFLGMSVVTVELLAPMVTLHWDWNDGTAPNRTIFHSNNCKMDEVLDLNANSEFSQSNSSLVYVSQYSRRTLTEELNLVCERSWLVSFANFLSGIGACVGNLMLRLTEKYGRKPFIVFVAVGSTVVTTCISFTYGYTMFTVCNLLFRVCTTQAYMILFVQAMEVTPQSQAPYLGVFMKSGYLVGQALLVGAAWIFQDWFYTQLFQTVITLPFLPISWYLLESPIWLAVRGKYKEARKVLEKIVKRNGLSLQEVEPKLNQWINEMKMRCEIESTAEKGTFGDLFKNKQISLYTCGLTFGMFAVGFVYNGLVMNAESFGSGLYVDLTLSTALSLFSVFLAGLSMKKISVRVLLITCWILEGLACIAYALSHESSLARTVFSVLGRMFVSPTHAAIPIYINEVFPTSVRGVGLGFTALAGFLLSSLSPFTKELAELTSVYVPFILFAIISVVSVFAYKMMPETKGRPMVHTVNELKSVKRSPTIPSVSSSLQTKDSIHNTVKKHDVRFQTESARRRASVDEFHKNTELWKTQLPCPESR